MKTSKIVVILLLLLTLSVTKSTQVLAAFNDVQLSSGSTLVITVGSSDLEFNVSSGNVESLNVGTNSLTFVLAAESSVTIASADKKNFGVAGKTSASSSLICNISQS